MATGGAGTSSGSTSTVFQFKITLRDIRPKIWRRIQVPENFTFWDLHCAIQDSMGWHNCHLFIFGIGEKVSNIYDRKIIQISMDKDEQDDWNPNPKLCAYESKLTEQFNLVTRKRALYEYDYGDSWIHEILLEKVLPADPGKSYPICLAGKRACPLEDIGGTPGYEERLEIIKNPQHREYNEIMEWLQNCGYEGFNPELFEPSSVVFANESTKRDCFSSFN